MEKTIKIASGPSREELFDSLRLCAEQRHVPFRLEFDNGIKNVPSTYIQAIEAEDGSGESWNIKMSIRKDFLEARGKIDAHWLAKDGDILPEFVTVKAYYSSKKRTGIITFE